MNANHISTAKKAWQKYFLLAIMLCSALLSCMEEAEDPQYVGVLNKPETVNKLLGTWESEYFTQRYYFQFVFHEDMTVTISLEPIGTSWGFGLPDDYNWITRDDNRIYCDFWAQDGDEDEPEKKIWTECILLDDNTLDVYLLIGDSPYLRFTKVKDGGSPTLPEKVVNDPETIAKIDGYWLGEHPNKEKNVWEVFFDAEEMKAYEYFYYQHKPTRDDYQWETINFNEVHLEVIRGASDQTFYLRDDNTLVKSGEEGECILYRQPERIHNDQDARDAAQGVWNCYPAEYADTNTVVYYELKSDGGVVSYNRDMVEMPSVPTSMLWCTYNDEVIIYDASITTNPIYAGYLHRLIWKDNHLVVYPGFEENNVWEKITPQTGMD